MLACRDITFFVNAVDLFIDLREELFNKKQKLYFRQIMLNHTQLKFNCPIHKNGQEKKPACFMNTENGLIHCFACNYSSDLFSMVSELLFNKYDAGESGKNYLLKKYAGKDVLERQNFIEGMNEKLDVGRITEKVKSYISEGELEKYRYIHRYMYQRNLTDDIIEKFDIGYQNNYNYNNKTYSVITFPIKDENGNVITILRRAIKEKRYFIERNIQKPIYGLFELKKEPHENVIVVESVFNCLSLISWGYNAIALLGVGNKIQADIINNLPNRKIYLCFDNDKAGYEGANNFGKLLNKVVYYIDIKQKNDVNELTKEQFEKFFSGAYL